MFKFGSTRECASQILREVFPVERSLRTGGKFVDQAIALWFGWYDDENGLPDWSAFQPFEHPQLLTHVSVTKRIDGRYAYVLLGESVRRWTPPQTDGSSPKVQGKFLDEVVPASVAHDVTMRCNRAYEDESPSYLERTMGWNPGHDFVRYRALILPFKCTRDGDPRILKIFDFETELD